MNHSGQAIRVFKYSTPTTSINLWLYAGFTCLACAVSLYLAILPFLFYWSSKSSIQEEKLVIIKDVGIQLTKVSKDGSTSHQFIERSALRDVVINEVRQSQALTPYDVYFYLAFVVIDQGQVIVPFQHFKQSLAQVKEVYYCSQELLLK